MCSPERVNQTFTIDNKKYQVSSLLKGEVPDFAHQSEFHHAVYELIKEWYSESPTITIKSSGSIGRPKDMKVGKERILRSIDYTRDFFALKPGEKALLCLPLPYIAGTMMVIRSLVIGMNLLIVVPGGRPLNDALCGEVDFASLTALQVYNSIKEEFDKKTLATIKNLIIVGGGISKEIGMVLRDFPNSIYSTYGMAETVSHIAMRRVSGTEVSECYIPFADVTVSLAEDDTLIISAPRVAEGLLHSNDVGVVFDDGSFQIIGRKDNTINSGGIKIHIETVENLLKSVISGNFAISSISDEKFGEVLVLVSEQDIDIAAVNEVLPAYYKPKKVIYLEKIPMTETDKIRRSELKQLLGTVSHSVEI
jgi:O-succinylbenzoic acid--CoA ligase